MKYSSQKNETNGSVRILNTSSLLYQWSLWPDILGAWLP